MLLKAALRRVKVEVEFLVDGELVTKGFSKTPFGMNFTSEGTSSLVEISKVLPHSHAEELGIQVGWCIQTTYQNGPQDAKIYVRQCLRSISKMR